MDEKDLKDVIDHELKFRQVELLAKIEEHLRKIADCVGYTNYPNGAFIRTDK